jgi:hypothetical protein
MSLLPAVQVDDLRQLDNAAPSLHSHYRSFNTTTGGSAPRSGIGILPHGVCHSSFPFASGERFSRSISKPVLGSCRLYTDCRRVRKQVSSRLVPEPVVNPGFDSMFIRNDASSASLLSLIFPIRTCHPSRMTFPRSLPGRPVEFHHQPPTEPCVNLSIYTARPSHSPATSR